MKRFRQTILPLLTVLLSSCDCIVAVKGKVISSSTGKPISGVTIKFLDRNVETISNSSGKFMIEESTGFCFDPEIKMTKNGYKPFQILISGDTESTSYQVKSESQSGDFDEPVYPDPSERNTFITGTSMEKYSQNFESKDDSLIVYLDTENFEKELREIKEKIKNAAQ